MDKETLEFALIGMCAIQIIQRDDSVSVIFKAFCRLFTFKMLDCF